MQVLSSITASSKLHPDKVADFESWKHRVKFTAQGPPERNHFVFDAAAQSIVYENSKAFVADTLNAIAYTQATYHDNRICWGGLMTINVDVMDRALSVGLSPEIVDEFVDSYAEQLVIGAIKAKRDRPEWLVEGRLSIRSYFYRMAKNEESFFDKGGAKWDVATVGIGCTAHLSANGEETIPDILMSTPGTALLSKFVRVVITCNTGDVGSGLVRGCVPNQPSW